MIFIFSLYNLLPKLYGLFIVIPLFIFYWFYLQHKVTKKYSSNSQTDELIKKEHDSSNLIEIANDKIVSVENIEFPVIKKIVEQFCTIYNQEKYLAIIRLSKKTTDSTILSFPYDITDELFIYLINYLNYPEGLKKDYYPKIFGWAVLDPENLKFHPDLLKKKIMAFIPASDNEYDHVFFISEDNRLYKKGFRHGVQIQEIDNQTFGYSFFSPQNTGNITKLSFIDLK